MTDPQSEPDCLVIERVGPVAILRLNRPDKLNALTIELRRKLAVEVPRLIEDPDCRVVMMTGTGRGFCSGGAFNQKSDLRATATRARMADAHTSWIRRVLTSDTMFVSAVNGPAAGAGFGLAMMADIVLASRDAFFKAGFPTVGAAPDYAIGWTLTRAVGSMRARDILMSNRRVDAEEAERIGLVSRLIEPDALETEALALCHQLAAGPYALGLTKTMVRKAGELAIDEFLELEAFSQGLAFASEDLEAGRLAFSAKRTPEFRGR